MITDTELDPVRHATAAALVGQAQHYSEVSSLSIPLIMAVVRSLYTPDLFGVCPATTPLVLDHTNTPLVIRSKKLRAVFHPEAMADLRAFHGEDASMEMLRALASTAALEIDKAHIQQVLDAAPKVLLDKAPAVAESILECVLELEPYNERSELPNRTVKWAILPTNRCIQVREHLVRRDLPLSEGVGLHCFHTMRYTSVNKESYTIKLYEDTFLPPNTVLCGSMSNAKHAAAIWYPYSILTTPTVISAEDFSPGKGTVERSAFCIYSPTSYRAIHIQD